MIDMSGHCELLGNVGHLAPHSDGVPVLLGETFQWC